MSNNKVSNTPITRRRFIYNSALAAGAAAFAGPAIAATRKLSANDKLNIGVVGVMGKGSSDMELCSGENIVAICDVDEAGSAGARAKHPQAKFYRDFRKMLDNEKSLDAVIVATPDHLHAVIASAAMRMGKHVYCQKPLTQTIWEARLLR